ncbi:glucose dehydrogenase [FAD, quinone]-like [Neocloeon triangulifer]|uniref:glucose dehydrogenase [FAD, quinone]-like n=1 Tax=Neocloeon triangulifer TaxID=2078957 RepID=UPI00286F08A3|nr:glucose dehydrogenase [FAD, quinone]-like [Neocloeon triangulifer]
METTNVFVRSVFTAQRIAYTLATGAPFIFLFLSGLFFFRQDLFAADERPKDTLFFKKTYDFIIVGGGSAGSVLANRLSEVADWQILLLEAGGPEPTLSEIPALMTALQFSYVDWKYRPEWTGDACLAYKDERCRWPRGKCLGGCSVLNAMLYIRGNRRDYDRWEELGNPGWSYEDILAYFLKSEDMRIRRYKDSPFHSSGGPLSVEYFNYQTPLVRDFLAAGNEMGYPVRDVNGGRQIGFTRSHATIRNGVRCSTAKAYLRPARNRPNLHISMFSHVEKILLENVGDCVAARGVVFKKKGVRHTVFASKEVILSAGAINTPQILMLSGLGPREHLEDVGVPVFKDIPGVGQNLQDHVSTGGNLFLVDNPVSYVLPRLLTWEAMERFIKRNEGPMATFPGAEVMAFVDTTVFPWAKIDNSTDIQDDWPDIQLFIGAFGDNIDGGVMGRRANGLSVDYYASVYEPVLYKDAFGVHTLLLRPFSRGNVTLRSNNPYDPPIIQHGYFTDRRDVETLIAGARFVVQWATQTAALRRHGARLNPNVYPRCGRLGINSDDYWECVIRHYSQTIYHPTCTAKMGPATDPMAVLDAQLRVRGVDGLRVVDASVMPNIVSGNTNAPVIAIAEKAADMIKEWWFAWGDQPYVKCRDLNVTFPGFDLDFGFKKK